MPGTDRPRRKQKTSSSSFLAQAHREYHEAMGAVMGLPVAAAVGYFLDTRWQTAPWCLIAGAILGAATTVVSLKELLQKLDKQSEQRRMQKMTQPTDGSSRQSEKSSIVVERDFKKDKCL